MSRKVLVWGGFCIAAIFGAYFLLFGILGFAEILRNEPLSKGQSEMLDQIEMCGMSILSLAGGVKVSVATAPASSLEFQVRDTGPGLSEDAKADLFRPFEQGGADVYSRHGGSGLGLYICRRLVDALGGKIEVESTPGSGATFKVRIPCRPVP